MKKCLVFGASNHYSYIPLPNKDVYVIAVDGGYRRLSQLKTDIDLLVGDFDSMQISEINNDLPESKVIKLNSEKDETDTLYALKRGLEEGCLEFHIFGGTGGRVEHTIANIQCLAFLRSEGANAFLYGRDYIMTCIGDEGIEFDEKQKGYISIFSQTGICKGVCIEGLKYELNEADVIDTFPVGVSNEFIGEKSRITVKEGRLLVVYPNKKRRIKI